MQTEVFQLIKNGSAQQAFQFTKIDLADPSDNQVQIEVSHFGLNYADIMARLGLYKECPPLPTVLGYEVVGTVVKVGNDRNQKLLNKKVVAFSRFGGYAKHINTPEHAVVAIDNLAADKALCLATQYVTAYYMTNCLTVIQPGEKALIHAAAGGVGIALLQLLKNQGVDCIAKVGSDEKMELIYQQGVEKVINYNSTDYEEEVEKLIGKGKLTLCFNPVAGSTFKKDMRLLAPHGRLLLFGGSERSGKKWGILSTLNFVRKMGLMIPIGLMMTSKSVLGVNMLHVGDMHPQLLQKCLNDVVALAKENKINPIVGASFSANELAQAHDLLESGKSTGKIIVKWSN